MEGLIQPAIDPHQERGGEERAAASERAGSHGCKRCPATDRDEQRAPGERGERHRSRRTANPGRDELGYCQLTVHRPPQPEHRRYHDEAETNSPRGPARSVSRDGFLEGTSRHEHARDAERTDFEQVERVTQSDLEVGSGAGGTHRTSATSHSRDMCTTRYRRWSTATWCAIANSHGSNGRDGS